MLVELIEIYNNFCSKFEDMDMNTTDAGVCCHETGCQTSEQGTFNLYNS